jgi:hypothetical protein
MYEPTRVFPLVKYGLPLMIFVWCFASLVNTPPAYREILRKFKDEKRLFVSDFLEYEIDGRFDGSGIAELCASKTWNPNLILSCDPPPGGLGLVKNAHLNCIRFAIEMGGSCQPSALPCAHNPCTTWICPCLLVLGRRHC